MHPRPVAVLLSRSKDGKINGCTVAWYTPINVEPFIFGVSVAMKRLTYAYIKESGEATLNILPASLVESIHYVGSISGRENPSKLLDAHFVLEKSLKVDVPHIKQSLAYVEARLIGEKEFVDHSLLYFEGVRSWVNEEIFQGGMWRKMENLLLHVGKNVYATECRYFGVEK